MTAISEYSGQEWQGRWLTVRVPVDPCLPPCDPGEHQLQVVHHTDDDGLHYCPTGFLMCCRCFGMADEPWPNQCTLWGELPE